MPPVFPARPRGANACALALLALAACAGPERAISPGPRAPTEAQAGAGTMATVPMLYHGGPVITSPKVVTIYWAFTPIFKNGPIPGTTGVGTADNSLVGHFLRNVGGTPYWSILSEYYESPIPPIKFFVQNSLGYTRYWANNVNVPVIDSKPTVAAVHDMLNSGMMSGKIPIDESTVYAVFADSAVDLGGVFASGACARHGSYSWFFGGRAWRIKYALMPYLNTKPSCIPLNTAPLSPNNDFPADGEISALAHELEEAITDPIPNPVSMHAWVDSQNAENADKCQKTFLGKFTTANGAKATMFIGGKPFVVQSNWRLGPDLANQVGCSNT